MKKNKYREIANNAKVDDDYAFTRQCRAYFKAICIWILDSGATKYVTSHKASFDTYEVIAPCDVHLSDCVVKTIRIGSIVVEVLVRSKIKRIHIKDAYHVSKLQSNLLLVIELLLSGLKVQFNLKKCIVRSSDDKIVAIVLRERYFYQINFSKVYEAKLANLVQLLTKDDALELWYRRFGNLNMNNVMHFKVRWVV